MGPGTWRWSPFGQHGQRHSLSLASKLRSRFAPAAGLSKIGLNPSPGGGPLVLCVGRLRGVKPSPGGGLSAGLFCSDSACNPATGGSGFASCPNPVLKSKPGGGRLPGA